MRVWGFCLLYPSCSASVDDGTVHRSNTSLWFNIWRKKNNPNYDLKEFLQWGEVMQKVMKVNLAPYLDFRDFLDRGTPDYSVVQQISG